MFPFVSPVRSSLHLPHIYTLHNASPLGLITMVFFSVGFDYNGIFLFSSLHVLLWSFLSTFLSPVLLLVSYWYTCIFLFVLVLFFFSFHIVHFLFFPCGRVVLHTPPPVLSYLRALGAVAVQAGTSRSVYKSVAAAAASRGGRGGGACAVVLLFV